VDTVVLHDEYSFSTVMLAFLSIARSEVLRRLHVDRKFRLELVLNDCWSLVLFDYLSWEVVCHYIGLGTRGPAMNLNHLAFRLDAILKAPAITFIVHILVSKLSQLKIWLLVGFLCEADGLAATDMRSQDNDVVVCARKIVDRFGSVSSTFFVRDSLGHCAIYADTLR
jgi:hypothetical protein